MARRILLLAVLLLAASLSTAGTINRGNKTGTGTTAFGDATVIEAAELNTDLDTLYTLVNGNLDNSNIDAAAAIALTKLNLTAAITDTHIAAVGSANIDPRKLLQTAASGTDAATNGLDADIVDDFSSDEDEMDDTTNAGTSVSNTPATNLEIEIAQLRYTIQRLAIGSGATAVALGGGTDTAAMWIDGPFRGGNLIYNGGFDVLDDLATGADGDGWTRVLTPTTLEVVALTPSEGQGDGNGLRVIDTGAALAGVSQTLTQLRADTSYLALVSIYDTTGTCRLVTTGADTNQLSVTSDDSASWQMLSGIFETDSTPTAVVVQLLAVAQSDSCIFNDIGVYEINTNPAPRGGKVHCYDSTNADTSDHYLQASGFVDSGVSCSVTPPGPGYMITVRGRMVAENSTAAAKWFEGHLRQACASTTTVDWSADNVTAEGATVEDTASLDFFYVNDQPTPGQVCTYTLEGIGELNFHLNEPGADTTTDTEPTTWIDVVMEPVG